jgi:hypothetical protein
MSHRLARLSLTLGASSLLLLSACGGIESEAKYPTGIDRAAVGTNDIYEDEPSIFGKGGLFGAVRGDKGQGDSITVNSYLWRAALDTVSFMPITSADPFGGTIITDWYSAPETPKERVKVNVLILDKQLKASGVKVNVFKQASMNGGWQDAPVSAETGRKLEDAILTRARQYRIEDKGE